MAAGRGGSRQLENDDVDDDDDNDDDVSSDALKLTSRDDAVMPMTHKPYSTVALVLPISTVASGVV